MGIKFSLFSAIPDYLRTSLRSLLSSENKTLFQNASVTFRWFLANYIRFKRLVVEMNGFFPAIRPRYIAFFRILCTVGMEMLILNLSLISLLRTDAVKH